MKKTLIIILIILLLLVAAAGLAGLLFLNNLDSALDPSSTEEISVEIPEGTYATGIGEILEEKGVIGSAFKFKLYLKKTNYSGSMKAGNYTLSPSMDFATIIEKLESNEVNDISVTVPEGLTIEQTAMKLAEQGAGTYEGFIRAIELDTYDYGWIRGDSLEGYLMPATYSVPVGSSEHDIINMMLQHFEEEVVSLYEETDNKVTRNYTLNEVATVASIIERECKVEDERRLVSSVIYNRIDNNIMLQMCSTVQYLILKETGEVKEVLYYDDLNIDSPYNTYIHYAWYVFRDTSAFFQSACVCNVFCFFGSELLYVIDI